MTHKLTQIKITGKGGQGISYAARMLAASAALQGKYACVSPTTTPQVRGGYVCMDVVISDGFIDYPRVSKADMLIAFSQDEYKFNSRQTLKDEGIVFYEPETISPDKSLKQKHYPLAAHEICRKQLGTDRAANMAMLSAIAKLTRIISLDALAKAVKTAPNPEEASANLKALDAGSKIAKKVRFP